MCYTPELLRHSSWAAESPIRFGKKKLTWEISSDLRYLVSDAAIPTIRNFEEIKTIDTVKT